MPAPHNFTALQYMLAKDPEKQSLQFHALGSPLGYAVTVEPLSETLPIAMNPPKAQKCARVPDWTADQVETIRELERLYFRTANLLQRRMATAGSELELPWEKVAEHCQKLADLAKRATDPKPQYALPLTEHEAQ